MNIYVISKTKHADMWRRFQSGGMPAGAAIISSWINAVGKSINLEEIWRLAVSEIAASDAIVVYREPNEIFNDAWPEIFFALHLRKPMFAVRFPCFEPGIEHCTDIEGAVLRAGCPHRSPEHRWRHG